MNDLPQNELLSAYLDGELTAAEQAEVERLLASSPAARQLLDDLRAVSTTLQSLPQEKLGEDLSRQVLRVAERRMLTEGEPDEAAVPSSHAFLQRFINRRSIFWLAITAAVAVMIALQERHEKEVAADKAGRQVALAPAGKGATPKRDADKSSELVNFRSTPNAISKGDRLNVEKETEEGAIEKKSGRKARESRKSATSLGAKYAKVEGRDKLAEPPGARAPTSVSELALPVKATPAAPALVPGRRDQPDKAGDAGETEKFNGKAAGLGPKAGGYGRKSGQAAPPNWYEGKAAAAIGSDVVLVFCDVQPEATKKKAFDNVLSQNGISPQARFASRGENQRAAEKAEHYQRNDNAKAAGNAMRRLAAGNVVRRQNAGNVELVYVEATPQQVQATLAGMAAQPTYFVSVSVKSPQDKAARQLVRRFATEGEASKTAAAAPQRQLDESKGKDSQNEQANNVAQSPAAAPAVDSAVAANQSPQGPPEQQKQQLQQPAKSDNATASTSQAPSPSQREAVTQQAAPAEPTTGAYGGALLEDGQQTLAAVQPAPRQRVLFVLRVAGGAAPVASEVGGQAGDRGKQSASPAPAATTPATPAAPPPSK